MILEIVIETFTKGSLILFVIFVTTVYAWYLIIDKYRFLKSEKDDFKNITDRMVPFILKKDTKSIKKILATRDNEFRNMFLELISISNKNKRKLENKAEEKFLHFFPLLRKNNKTIAVIASVTPLLGLLGTVTGMVKTFEVIHLFGSANPILMADGISEALITTQAGLLASFPILLALSYLRSSAKNIEQGFTQSYLKVINIYTGWEK